MANSIVSIFMSIILFICTLFRINCNTENPTGYGVYNDVSYGESSEQVFDLVIPEGVGDELSLCVYIHGGAWTGGDKSNVAFMLKPYAEEKGMVTANVNYRLLKESQPELNYKTLCEDVNEAIKKVVSICEEKGIAIKKAMVMGESAGGHISLMYAYTYYDKCPVEIGLVYSICGPTDMTDVRYFTENEISPEYMLTLQSLLTGKTITAENRFSPETIQAQLEASPINYVNENTVPTIFNSCGKDTLVPVSNGEHLEKLLKSYGVDYYYAEFVNSIHCARNKRDVVTTKVFDIKLDEMIDKYVK